MRKLVRAETRQQARRMVTRAIINGILIRPEECSNCGRSKPDAKKAWIEAHHHKGYLHPYTLDVIWLCPRCHKLAHPNSKEGIERIRAANTGRKRSPESIAKQKETTKGYTGEQKGWTQERRDDQHFRCKEVKPWLGKQ